MKKFTLITTILLTANILFGQINKIDTSFYSEALQETKMVDIYFPPGYDENPDLYYPVIYYLHYWSGDQNTMGSEMISWTQSLINNGTIDPVIMVGADNSPEPFNGSCYLNSPLWGNYEDYMIDDLITWIESSFRAMPGRDYRAAMGHSMGSYGSFRFGILHKDKFRAIAAHAGPICFDADIYLETCRQQIILENQPGPPFSYNFLGGPQFTRAFFLFCGASSPNPNSTQTYINPQIVDYAVDEYGEFIDSVVVKLQEDDIYQLIEQLTPSDSVGIYFGCGTNDSYLIYPSHIALKDKMDSLELPYEFYSHDGGHSMPGPFKQRALTFLDSLLMPPIILPSSCLPEGITFTTQEEIDNFQINHPNCTEIEGDVEIYGSDITNLFGLNALNSIGKDLSISNQYNLINLSGLDSLHSIGGSLTFYRNEDLVTSEGLNALESIGGSLRVGWGGTWLPGGTSLQSLSGFENLQTVGGTIEIFQSGLSNLQGLENLISIGGDVSITSNDILSSLYGIQNIAESSIENIDIAGNSNLSECDVQSICDYLASPNGSVEIYNNASGCNSPEEVDSICNVQGVFTTGYKQSITIYPNPVYDLAFLSFNIQSKSPVEVCIYNTTGICVKSWQFQNQQPGEKEFALDLKKLNAGVYFCRVQIGNEMITKKIIKL